MTAMSAIADAMGEAARWHLLAVLFTRPRPGWKDEIEALSREVSDVVLRAVVLAAGDAGEGAYLGVLGPGGMVSPREAAYCGARDPGWILADLARYYDAFGYAPRVEDPLDHVAVEAGFVGYLHLKEALARSSDDEEAATTSRSAREAFMRDHLAILAGSLAPQLARLDAGYLAGAADVLAAHTPGADRVPAVDADGEADACEGCGTDRDVVLDAFVRRGSSGSGRPGGEAWESQADHTRAGIPVLGAGREEKKW